MTLISLIRPAVSHVVSISPFRSIAACPSHLSIRPARCNDRTSRMQTFLRWVRFRFSFAVFLFPLRAGIAHDLALPFEFFVAYVVGLRESVLAINAGRTLSRHRFVLFVQPRNQTAQC